jgi:hypothetical protein
MGSPALLLRIIKKTTPFFGRKKKSTQGRTGLALFLHGLKVGFAHLQTHQPGKKVGFTF